MRSGFRLQADDMDNNTPIGQGAGQPDFNSVKKGLFQAREQS
jgi:hypothetical protein